MRVAVGSQNPAKVTAVQQAFETVWPDESWETVGVKVGSGVSDQPMTDAESLRGARQRAQASRKALDTEYGVGIEAGLQEIDGQWLDSGWIVVIQRDGGEGIGTTARIEIPAKLMADINAGDELGIVADRWFERNNLKHGQGYFGVMTDGAIDRIAALRDGTIFALSRFLHAELFED